MKFIVKPMIMERAMKRFLSISYKLFYVCFAFKFKFI